MDKGKGRSKVSAGKAEYAAALSKLGGCVQPLHAGAAVTVAAVDLMAHSTGGSYVEQRVRMLALKFCDPATGGCFPP
jgi:hypothetical protein